MLEHLFEGSARVLHSDFGFLHICGLFQFVKTKIAVSKLVEVESEQEDVFPINAEGKDVVAAGDDSQLLLAFQILLLIFMSNFMYL